MTEPVFVASFDIEDWFHAENLHANLPTSDWSRLESRVERNTHQLLDIVADAGVKSTFFVLGWIARRYPALVRRIVDEGHEVASHSDAHHRLYDLPRKRLTDDLARARDALEQVAGVPVWGLRAPVFSISDAVVDCLEEAGYWYDSSFYPFKAHDRYGRISLRVDPDAPIVQIRPGLLELPMSQLTLGPLVLPWSGGGYFRVIPYQWFRFGVRQRLNRCSWFTFYLHPWELDTEELPPPGTAWLVRVRAYAGRSRMRRDLRRLLAEFGSTRIDWALRSKGYRPPRETKRATALA